MKRSLLLALMAASAISSAQLIVGNDQSGVATIWAIDVTTGTATSLYAANNNNAKPWGMAADEANSILYWNNGATLYSATYASLLSGTPTINSIGMTFNAATVNYVALAFNPNSGKLIGTRNIATEAYYEIDPTTGVSTQINIHNTSYDWGGLDWDTSTGKLYGLTDAAPAGGPGRGLYEINPAAPSETFIFGYPNAETDIDGLAVGNGRAYYVSDGPNTTQVNFYVIDIATASQVGTIASPFTGSGTFSAGAWAPGLMNPIPEPATSAALLAGAGLLLARRRRSR